jgi:hypothetical protein
MEMGNRRVFETAACVLGVLLVFLPFSILPSKEDECHDADFKGFPPTSGQDDRPETLGKLVPCVSVVRVQPRTFSSYLSRLQRIHPPERSEL